MLKQQAVQAQRELHSPLSSAEWVNCSCPTVVAVAITPSNQVVMVHPTRAYAHAWIFPQGKISQRNETLFQAATRVLQAELGYPPDLFEQQAARFVGRGAVSYDQGKQYYVVVLPMKWSQPPQLNIIENCNWCSVGGPCELMRKIRDCSDAKKDLIKRVLRAAIRQGLLYKNRWSASHASTVIRST